MINTPDKQLYSMTDWKKGNISICCAEREELPKGIDWDQGIEACSQGSCKIFDMGLGESVLVCITGVGKVSAAAAIQHLLDIHGVSIILDVGFCGSLNKNVKTNELILITKTTDYDGFFHWESPDCEPGTDAPWIYPRPELVTLVKDTAQSLGVSLYETSIITAERPLHNSILANTLANKFQADCVDMESSAIASVCTKHHNAAAWLCLKVRCDNADEHAYQDHNVAKNKGIPSVISELLKNLIDNIYSVPANLSHSISASSGKKRETTDEELLKRNQKTVWNPFSPPVYTDATLPRVMVRARGVRIWDARGRCYFDATSGTKNVILGHSHPALFPFIVEQGYRLEHWPADGFTSVPLINFSEKLLSHLSEKFGHVFTNSGGSEAVETAIRIAREYHRSREEGGRYKVLSLSGSYHGSTLGTMSITGHAPSRIHTGPLLEGVVFGEPPISDAPEDVENALQAIERAIEIADSSTFSCFIFEPVQGLGGVRPLPVSFMESLSQIAKEIGALVIVDEVASGLCRTGHWFDFQRSQIQPDIITCGKALTNGIVPLSSTIASCKVFQNIQDRYISFFHGHTYSGHPLGAEAGYRVLKIMDQLQILDNVRERSLQFQKEVLPELQKISSVKEVRHVGLWIGIEMYDPASGNPVSISDLSASILRNGVMHDMLGTTIGLSPPLIVGAKDWNAILTIILETISRWKPER